MNLKNYTKLLLILGLFAVVPVQGMSYVSYAKSLFVKKTLEKNGQEKEMCAFFEALKKGDYVAVDIFKALSDKNKIPCLSMLAMTKNEHVDLNFEKYVVSNMFADKVIKKYLQSNDKDALGFFVAAIKSNAYYLAQEIFKESSKNVRLRNAKTLLSLLPADSNAANPKIQKILYDLSYRWLLDASQDDDNAVQLFSMALSIPYTDYAYRIFIESSENARLECVKILSALSKKSLNQLEKLCIMQIYWAFPKYSQHFATADFEILIDANCPSYKHLKEHTPGTGDELVAKFHCDSALSFLMERVIDKERDFSEDYYTFMHGQRSEYYFPERVYTFLWQLHRKRTLKDFFFAHVKDLATQDELAIEKVQRNFLMNNYKYDVDNRKKLLFMNYALFANSYNLGSNSAYYVVKNHNAPLGTFDLPVSEPFKRLGYDHIYSGFKDELEELGHQYDKKCPYGNLLFIAIPKEKIHKYVNLVLSGGVRAMIPINGEECTGDVRLILETLINQPEKLVSDRIEFSLIMTQKKGGLDPDTGIKIIPILSGDPAKLAELQKKEDALFAKIKAAIEKEDNAKATAINRADTIVNHLVLSGKDAQGVAPAKTMARINNIMGHIQPQQRMN